MTKQSPAGKARMGRPKAGYLKKMSKVATVEQLQPLIAAAISAVMTNQDYIIVVLSYMFMFPKGFPRGILVSKEGLDDVHKIKSGSLVTWMYEHGYTEHSLRSLILQRREFDRKLTMIEMKLDGLL